MTAHICREFNPACYRCDLGRDELPPPHECDSGNFDRIACPPPCSTMHTHCSICGDLRGHCVLDD